MKFTNESINLENGLKREWLLTNGLGGYASSTVIGTNTRKYHGLLVAPLNPPGRRFLKTTLRKWAVIKATFDSCMTEDLLGRMIHLNL